MQLETSYLQQIPSSIRYRIKAHPIYLLDLLDRSETSVNSEIFQTLIFLTYRSLFKYSKSN